MSQKEDNLHSFSRNLLQPERPKDAKSTRILVAVGYQNIQYLEIIEFSIYEGAKHLQGAGWLHQIPPTLISC